MFGRARARGGLARGAGDHSDEFVESARCDSPSGFGYRAGVIIVRTLLVLALVGCGSSDKHDPAASDPEASRSPDPVPAKKGEPLPALADNAPVDQAKTLTADRLARIAELTTEAMKSYPDAKARYLRGLPAGEHFFVVATLTSGSAKENVFIAVNSIKDGTINGTIASDIMNVSGFKAGDAYAFAEDRLVDWLISKPDGSEEGNIVGKFLDTQP